MGQRKNLRLITLDDLWQILIRNLFVIFLTSVMAIGSFWVYGKYIQKPVYTSTATLYILRQENQNASSDSTSTDFSLALNVVKDCTYLLKSRNVLDEVSRELGLTYSYNSLYAMVSTYNPTNTRILEVKVTDPDPEEAKAIVDKICDIGSGQIAKAMGFNQVNVYEYGTLETKASNSFSIQFYLVIGLITAMIVYLLHLVNFLLDDRLRGEEDIEHYLGYSVLGNIPNVNGK